MSRLIRSKQIFLHAKVFLLVMFFPKCVQRLSKADGCTLILMMVKQRFGHLVQLMKNFACIHPQTIFYYNQQYRWNTYCLSIDVSFLIFSDTQTLKLHFIALSCQKQYYSICIHQSSPEMLFLKLWHIRVSLLSMLKLSPRQRLCNTLI